MMRWIALSLLLLAPLQASAAERKDGSQPGVPGEIGNVQIIGGNTGSTYRGIKVTDEGAVYTKDMFPPNYQFEPFVIVSDTTRISITTGWKQLGNAWASGRFSKRQLSFYVVNGASGVTTDSISVRILSSDDLVVWRDLYEVNSGGPYRVPNQFTIKMANGAAAARTLPSISLPDDLYYGKYSIVMAKRDSSAGASTALPSMGVTAYGRE